MKIFVIAVSLALFLSGCQNSQDSSFGRFLDDLDKGLEQSFQPNNNIWGGGYGHPNFNKPVIAGPFGYKNRNSAPVGGRLYTNEWGRTSGSMNGNDVNLRTDEWGYTRGSVGNNVVNCHTIEWGYTYCY